MTTSIGDASPSIGGRYVIERELGRGGMATVYLAEDVRHGRRVALKLLRPELATTLGPERFEREIRIAAGLAHPHVLPLYDSGRDGDRLFYVMPFVDGETLGARLAREGPLPVAEAVRLAIEIAEGLEHAHRRGIVHRDVKPDNVMLSDGHAIVTDFGIAHAVLEASAGRLTNTGVALGTPAYMSPEQAGAERAIDARSDVFSLGCVLHEMLSGASPFAAPTLAATLGRVLTAPAPPLARPDAPSALGTVLDRALEKEPDRRFPSAGAFADALREVQLQLTQTGASGRVAGSGTGMRHTRARAVAIGALIVTAAVVAIALLRRDARAGELPSVAVLPFANESGDSANAYVGAGIAEELLTALADVPGLRVASRTSSFALGATPAMRDVARQLGVKTVLEGSVRRAGGTMRVTARLVDAERDTPIWSERFDRPVSDLFAVQEDIARSIVQRLRVRLAAGDSVLVRRRTQRADVHDLVMRARHLSWQAVGVRDSLLLAASLLREAESLDSSYADTWAEEARVYESLAIFRDQSQLPGESGMAAGEMLRRARVAAERAVRFDSASARAWAVLGNLVFRYDWDWAAAERHFRRALALNPTSAEAYQQYQRFLRSMGRFAEARAMLDSTWKYDAMIAGGGNGGLPRGRIAYFEHDFARAVRETRSDTATRTARVGTNFFAQALVGAGQYATADSLMRSRQVRAPGDTTTIALIAALSGRAAQARAILASARGTAEDSPLLNAGVLAALGDTSAALLEVRRGIETRDPLVVDLKVDPRLDPLRGTAEFRRIMAQLRFP